MNIWLVAFYFPPMNIIGAERPKKFLRHLVSKGHTVTVFSVAVPGEEFSGEFEGVKCRRSRVAFSEYHFRSSDDLHKPSWLRRFIPRALTALLDDSGWTWMPYLRRDLEKALSEEAKPDVVIATGRPFLTFLTVSKVCRRHGIPFVLDFRDAWSNNPHPSYDTWARRTLLRWLERRVNCQASAVLTISSLTGEALNTGKRPLIIYNLPDQGYINELEDYTPATDQVSPTCLSLVFAGTLYPGRDLDPICAAIAKLEPEQQERIEVHYCGHSPSRAKESFLRHGIERCLILHGSLSKEDAVSLVAASDIALSIICSEEDTANDALRGVITTKVFDYLILDKEVLNVVPEGFEFNAFAKQIGIVGLKNFEPGDVAGMARYLRGRLQAKLTSGETLRGAGDGAAALTGAWATQMESFDALLKDVAQ